jgi:hypothetical protein
MEKIIKTQIRIVHFTSIVASFSPTCFNFSRNGHYERLGQQACHKKKTTGLLTIRFSTISSFFDNSTSFYCKYLCLDALERYFIEKNSKNNKKSITTILKKTNSWLIFFYQSKKITNEQQLYDVCFLQGVCDA